MVAPSCEDHLFVLSSIIRNNLSEKKRIYAAFIDFNTVFDIVNRGMLLYKILENGIHGKVYYVIKEICRMIEASVRVNKSHSDWFVIQQGVREGDTLSSTMFLVYINDLIQYLNRLGVGINLW